MRKAVLAAPVAVPGARWIPLTRGRWTLVDEADFARVARYTWCFAGKYAQTTVARRKIYLHALVFGPVTAPTIDHINGDKLDNRRANLRVATQPQQAANSAVRYDNACGYRGVYLHDARLAKPWRARYKTRHLGFFATAEEAALAYDTALYEAHGEYARVNVLKGRR